jgi:hypothetical protein
MAKDKNEKKSKISSKEPVFIIRPANKNLGLDYLHITLIALVIILVAVAFALTTFKQGTIITNCQFGSNSNATCNSTIHTSAQALSAAERQLAAYSNVNTSLSLIPYYALVNQSKVSYLVETKQWIVTIPYIDPLVKNEVFNVSLLLYDSNLTLASAYLQTLKPGIPTNNSVVALGAVNIAGEAQCKTTTPIPVYVVTDPYSPGTISTINSTIHTAQLYGNKINVSYFFIFGGYSQQFYSSFGIPQTQLLGQYMECASRQPDKFPAFLSNLSIVYTGRPLENETLSQVEVGSGLNASKFGDCMDNVTTTLDIQSQFAKLYNIVSTPTIIVNCRYSTIPQSINYAINYSLSNLNG